MSRKGLINYHKNAELIPILGRETGTCTVTRLSEAWLRMGLNKRDLYIRMMAMWGFSVSLGFSLSSEWPWETAVL